VRGRRFDGLEDGGSAAKGTEGEAAAAEGDTREGGARLGGGDVGAHARRSRNRSEQRS
jgi:hypothetical protein